MTLSEYENDLLRQLANAEERALREGKRADLAEAERDHYRNHIRIPFGRCKQLPCIEARRRAAT